MADESSKTDQADAVPQVEVSGASVPTTEAAPDTPAPMPQQSQDQETPQKDVVMADVTFDQAAVRQRLVKWG